MNRVYQLIRHPMQNILSNECLSLLHNFGQVLKVVHTPMSHQVKTFIYRNIAWILRWQVYFPIKRLFQGGLIDLT